MFTNTVLRISYASLLLGLFAAAGLSDTLAQVTSESGQNYNDGIYWSGLGADQTAVAASFNTTTALGATVGVSLAGSSSVVAVVCPSPGACSWTGGTGGTSPFVSQQAVLWASNAANGGNGPVTLTFAKDISGAGALIQANVPGQFTAQIQAFNGTTSLGSFTVNSDAAGDPVYIGLQDQTGFNITSVTFSLTACGATALGSDDCNDFSLGTVYLVAASSVLVSPSSLTFASQNVGTASAAQSVTVSDPGPGYYGIRSIAVSGANPGDYSQTNNCPNTLSAGDSCTISVTFAPSAPGARSATLTVTEATSTQSVSLSGTGVGSAATAFLTAAPPKAALRNNYAGFLGMEFTVGNTAIKVIQLGRWVVAGNSGTHVVKLVNAGTGADVAGGSVTLSLAGATPGEYAYATLSSAVTLTANTAYYVLSQEASGGDQFYDQGPVTVSAGSGTVNGSAYKTYYGTYPIGEAGSYSYIPVNFLFVPDNQGAAFLTGQPNAPLRNNFSGFVGMEFTVGSNGITVSQLGRWVVAGNSGTHVVKLVNASTGVDVADGSVSLSLAGATAGQYAYAVLPGAIALAPYTSYYIVSQEASGGDQWYDEGPVTTGSAFSSVDESIYEPKGSYLVGKEGSYSYGPLNFVFLPNNQGSAFLTGQPKGALRNNFSGSVGMEFTVGSNAITITELGRWVVSGNSGTHLVKLVNASTGVDVAGGSVSLSLAGATAGQYAYSPLSSAITLPANASYYIVSQEVSAGDQWYDEGAVTAAAGSATVNGSIYYRGTGSYLVGETGSYSYGPVNFLILPENQGSHLLTGQPKAALRNNFSGSVGLEFTVGNNAITVAQLGRWVVAGNSGTHVVKLVNAGTGADVPGGSVTLSLAGATGGQYAYAALSGAITLFPGSSYYLVSQEISGGDQWYDEGAVTPGSSSSTVNGSIYYRGAGSYLIGETGSYAYRPVNFLFY